MQGKPAAGAAEEAVRGARSCMKGRQGGEQEERAKNALPAPSARPHPREAREVVEAAAAMVAVSDGARAARVHESRCRGGRR